MTRVTTSLRFLATAALMLSLGACATSQKWAVSGVDRTDGVVRISYEYPEFKQPEVSDAQALKIAQGRCSGWGYDAARAIPGQTRQCSNMEGGNCNLWTVTREYQCTSQGAFASNLSK